MDLSAINPVLLIASLMVAAIPTLLPAPAIRAFQGVLLFSLLAMDVLSNFRIRFGQKGK